MGYRPSAWAPRPEKNSGRSRRTIHPPLAYRLAVMKLQDVGVGSGFIVFEAKHDGSPCSSFISLDDFDALAGLDAIKHGGPAAAPTLVLPGRFELLERHDGLPEIAFVELLALDGLVHRPL